MELAITIALTVTLFNVISAETGTKLHQGRHNSARSNGSPAHSFGYSNFGKHNPVINERSAKVGHNQQGDKLITRDTAAASSFSQTSPQQPDPSIALLPRGDQESSLFAKESGSSNPFSGSSTSETNGFGGSQLGGFQQGIQLPGFPSTFGGFTFNPSASPAVAAQGTATGRNPQGVSIARYPQSFQLGGFAPYGNALGAFPQGLPVAGFPIGTTFGGLPQTAATFGAFQPAGTFTGFPYGTALSPVPGAFGPPGVPGKGQQPSPVRGSPYPYGQPTGFQIYNQVPAQAYQSQSQK